MLAAITARLSSVPQAITCSPIVFHKRPYTLSFTMFYFVKRLLKHGQRKIHNDISLQFHVIR